MRTTKFRDVFNKVVRLHGRDPRAPISTDLSSALVDHINQRVSTIWAGWRWPEWEITEERAFRQVWNASHQYFRSNPNDNRPDEVFYVGDDYATGDDEFGDNYGYYRVVASALTDPVIGTSPNGASDDWEAIDPLDTYIAYDQACRRAIGIVRGIYSANPRVATCSNRGGLCYHPSEKGIDVCGTGVPTVFVTHTMPCPEYTMTPWVTGKSYVRGDTVFDFTTGECFQSVTTTTNVVTNTDWNWVPFLSCWLDYVKNGSFADSLMEFDQGGNGELQAKMVLNQYWNTEADDALQAEVDLLVAQGQKLHWNFCKPPCGYWRESEQWTGIGLVSITSGPSPSSADYRVV